MHRILLIISFGFVVLTGFGQRLYRSSSVLASGNWFKIAIAAPGVYKVDLALFGALGITGTNIPSSAIRLFGNGGQMLPENCSGLVSDDLTENAIQVVDGGDGIFNGADYFLFYAAGPDVWTKDPVNKRFHHQKNIYSSQSFYFISIAGAGKRITKSNAGPAANVQVTSFNYRYFHELDTINLLNSGKEWYGEEFANSPGKSPSRSFTIQTGNTNIMEPAVVVSSCIARSINRSSSFQVTINNSRVIQHNIGAVSSSSQDVFANSSVASGLFMPSPTMQVSYNYLSESQGAQGWLNWFEVFTRKLLSIADVNQLLFRDWNSVGAGNSAEFRLQAAGAGTRVWDISDPLAVAEMQCVVENGILKFVNESGSLHEYIAFNPSGFLVPVAAGKVENQDLHAPLTADFLIITFPALVQEAQRLADFHQLKDKLKVVIVTARQVFNEFASGSPDPTAIRDFVKMYYDRAGSDTTRRVKYLLLFGDASFDYKDRWPNNTNFVPAYESNNSLDPLATFTSDDYFGFLGDKEDINTDTIGKLLDIGIGRIPAKSAEEARSYIDKLIIYSSAAGFGNWRNQISFIADDEDFNLHFDDAEIITATAAAANATYRQHKIYLDAYPQESNSSGSRYPAVNRVINNLVQNGTLIWNYNGHGGYRRLAEEVILDQDIVNAWNNPGRLPLFITATCDFAPFDNASIRSLGEDILLRPKTGAIALMTTTRLVFAYSNRIMNRNYMQVLLHQQQDGSYPSLGDAVKMAKNNTTLSGSDFINNLKFTLLGDPALTIAFPRYRVTTNTINGIPVSALPDTVKALKQYTVTGEVTDYNGSLLNDFNGSVYSSVYDKVQTISTLGNDPESVKENFEVQENIVFKGKATVKNGRFSFRFLVPKDINYQFGNGTISYYAENGLVDANGSFTNFIIGGTADPVADNQGPEIKAFLNDEKFINGGTTGTNSLLIVKLSDSSGINIVGTGIGHDISVIMDNDPLKTYTLNEFFEPSPDTYQGGVITFPLRGIKEGMHTLRIKAWDAVNNSSEITITFRVVMKQAFSIFRVINFPNPFNSKTTFRFEHDLDDPMAVVSINIYTNSGRLVKSIRRTINTGGNRSSDIEWDGKNENGVPLHQGIYVYKLGITGNNGTIAEKSGKIMIR